jgi:hypothetical protein
MNIQLIHIEQLQSNGFPGVLSPQKAAEYEYVGIAIEDQGLHYYWARGVSLRITEQEYRYIKANPKLYYFSTALKLHLKIHQQLQNKDFHGL